MDIVNFPAEIAKRGILEPTEIIPADDLLVIGKKVNYSRNGSQYQNFPMKIQDFLTLHAFTQVSYTDLLALMLNNDLVVGSQYIISDYQTVYDQPDYDGFGVAKTPGNIVTLTGPVEPLVVTAASTSTLALEVVSTVYPQDIIWYDPSFKITEVKGTTAKGRIIRRIDFENMNTTGYDHRHVVFKRYESSPGSGIYNIIKDNGGAFRTNIPTFGDECENMNLDYIRVEAYTPGLDDPIFLVPNNIFGGECEEFYAGQDFYNNTIGSFCYGVRFNHNTHDNIIGDSFYNNVIANEFANNVIGDAFNLNNIGSAFAGNTIGNNFSNNNVGNNFGYSGANIIGDNFMNNAIFNDFYNNHVADNFMNNVMHHEFSGFNGGLNTILSDFQNVYIKSPVQATMLAATGFNSTPQTYLEGYKEVFSGFTGGLVNPQRVMGWYDSVVGNMVYTGL